MATVAAGIAVAFLVVALLRILYKYASQLRFCATIPSPGMPYPIIGHSYLFMNVAREDILDTLLGLAAADPHHRKMGAIVGNEKLAWFFHPEPVETILSSNEYISKSREYIYLQPWLGTGLLLSTHDKWRVRRKLLTPAFHFRILDDSLHVFNRQGSILADVLTEDRPSNKESIVDLFPYVTRCTLDVILETAMGQVLGIQTARQSHYANTINDMVHIMQQRQLLPWLQNDILFSMSSMKAEYDECLSTLHEFTQSVIKEKRALFNQMEEEEEGMMMKKKKGKVAFMDLLLKAELPDGSKLNDADIQEEVDTFMFEGHDTTACAISWSLYLLGKHPDIQERAFKEQQEIFQGRDLKEATVTMEDLGKMKYLEACVKEALRLYPSVPIIARLLEKDAVIDGKTFHKGSTVVVFVHLLHRNPLVWDNPEEFQPERFIDASRRHPYAYVPFSAGPRNCIGQRFALMEEKTILSHVLRRLVFESRDKEVKPVIEIITRPHNGISSYYEERHF